MQKIIYDIIHGNIEYSNFEGILLKNPIVNRLHQILQNSTAYRVYPNLKTSRFEHSLGVMNYSGKMYRFGLLNSDKEEEYLREMHKRLKNLIAKDEKKVFNKLNQSENFKRTGENYIKEHYHLGDFNKDLPDLLDNPIFIEDLKKFIGKGFIKRNANPTKEEFEGVNILLFQTVRFFGLTHDIGHLPLSHLFEFALAGVYEKLADNNNRNALQDVYLEKLGNFFKNKESQKDKIHEVIGKNIARFIFQDVRMNLAKKYNSNHNKDNIISILITYLIQLIWQDMIKEENGSLNSIYSIVDGTIDSDRLDFVRRDGYLSGVLKSPGNVDRIIETFCLGQKSVSMRKSFDDDYSFMPSVQSLNDVEEVIHHRFRIYKYVVNHHAVRRSDYIFQKVIENKLMQELITMDDLEENSLLSSRLISVIDISNEILNDIDVDVVIDNIRKLIQLTDFWLLSVLNKDFIQYCENEIEDIELV